MCFFSMLILCFLHAPERAKRNKLFDFDFDFEREREVRVTSLPAGVPLSLRHGSLFDPAVARGEPNPVNRVEQRSTRLG